MSFIGKLFGARTAAAPDSMKLDGTSEAALTRSLSALPPDERGWITFAEARNFFSTERAEYAFFFSTERAEYAFGELDQDGRKNIESFAAQNRAAINFMPVEGRVYFLTRSLG